MIQTTGKSTSKIAWVMLLASQEVEVHHVEDSVVQGLGEDTTGHRRSDV